jgi:ADP-glucose pyrophosphorylase
MGKAPAYWRGGDTIDTYGEAHMDLVSPQADLQLSQPLMTTTRDASARTSHHLRDPWRFRLGQEGGG